MAQGGNISGYRPSLVQHKVSPTGRKISFDRSVNTSPVGRVFNQPSSTISSLSGISTRRVSLNSSSSSVIKGSYPHYENIPSLVPTVTITITQEEFFAADSQYKELDDQTKLWFTYLLVPKTEWCHVICEDFHWSNIIARVLNMQTRPWFLIRTPNWKSSRTFFVSKDREC